MWEKIVLNLLSNALKFTFEGEIGIILRRSGDHVELLVWDTGTGIDEHDLTKVFERFHRIKGARSRTHEGTGIGLALVQEIARLHGGSASVSSQLGKGSTFTVTIPLGSAHLPAHRNGKARASSSAALQAKPFLDEAARWTPEEVRRSCDDTASLGGAERESLSPATSTIRRTHVSGCILLADDNADMRDYVRRLLEPRYEVQAVADGEAALAIALQSHVDLVLTDVMMPRLDGFELLRALRSHPDTSGIPVILLSARAGEESSVEGLEAGADDYLVKPF